MSLTFSCMLNTFWSVRWIDGRWSRRRNRRCRFAVLLLRSLLLLLLRVAEAELMRIVAAREVVAAVYRDCTVHKDLYILPYSRLRLLPLLLLLLLMLLLITVEEVGSMLTAVVREVVQVSEVIVMVSAMMTAIEMLLATATMLLCCCCFWSLHTPLRFSHDAYRDDSIAPRVSIRDCRVDDQWRWDDARARVSQPPSRARPVIV